MTHRHIRPIAINGFEPGGTPRAYPIFEDVDPCTLLVDEGYQRDSSERSLKLVRKIVAGWDWAKFKVPVAVMTDAGLELIDGQHTAIAAATHPDIETIPVMIVDVEQRKERAAAFIGQNRDRVSVTAAQLHVAALAAGSEEALAIDRVCSAAGVTVLRAQPGAGRYKPATTVAVSAVSALIRGRGEDVATTVMACLAKTELAPITQIHIKATDLLLNVDEYSSQITAEQLSASINAMGVKVDTEAAVFRAAHPSTPLWKAVAICWFKSRRNAKANSQLRENPALSRKAETNESLGREFKPELSGNSGQLKSEPSSADLRTASGKLIENITHRQANPMAISAQRRPVIDSGKVDSRPKLSGWVPGPFLLRCSGCDEKYQGDRRSRSCADCAYGSKEAVSA